MWKRLNNTKGERQPALGELRYDEKSPTGIYGLGIEIRSAHSPPQRPPRGDMEPKGLPRLPFELAPPEVRNSKNRPTSSTYSEHSPNPIITTFPPNSYAPLDTAYKEEVSPPSSPEYDYRQRNQIQPLEEDVSPIDEMLDVSALSMDRPGSSSKPTQSNIPVLRREKRRNQVAAAAANVVSRKEISGQSGRPAKNPSWDPYSGEPTTSERGKPQTTKPGQFTPTGLRSVRGDGGRGFGSYSVITAAAPKKPISFGDKIRNLKANNNIPEERPQWKGASGRATIVPAPADNPNIPPISIPRRSAQPAEPPGLGPASLVSYPQSGNKTVPATSRNDPATIRTLPQGDYSHGNAIHTSQNSSVFDTYSSGKSQTYGNVPIVVPAQEKPYSPEESKFRDENNNSEYTTSPVQEPYIQPPSRFSISTYATSEARSTPRPSTDTFEPAYEEPPPMPTPPKIFTNPEGSQSILNRTRPKVGRGPRGGGSGIGITRKAVNTSSPIFISMTAKRASAIAKSLPSTPAEIESHDLVTSLQAQLDDLQHRRNNITRGIRQMTELMPADNITLTTEVRRKREEEKRKVEGLREEEAVVRQQEHEIGLRLHRAWKRRDKEATFEPTGLWVRRVTG